MALSPTYSITPSNDGATVTADNDTTYGGANQDRNEAAEFVLWSKTNKNGVRTFTNPEQGNVLTNLQYTLTTEVDGWFELIRLRIQFYDAAANYVEQQTSGSGAITQYASVFYYQSTGKVYKAVADSTGEDPEDANFFTEVSLSELYTLIDNSNLETYVQDYNHNYNTNAGLRDRYANVHCCTAEDRDLNQTLLYLKESADINFSNGNPELYEKIIRDIEAQLNQSA